MKQLLLAFAFTVATVSGISAQNTSPGNSPVIVGHKPKPIRVAPKQQPQNGRAPIVNAPARPQPNVVAYSAALGRYQHARHTRFWWKNHFTTIVLVGGGYYYWDAGYWFPAWGYDPNYEAYDYDGPIFTYGNLLPDQVIINVQRALQDLGYFSGTVSGSLSPATRRAISAYQQDEGLEVNGVVDGPTVYALGLI
ncbi:MAG TPA: peptidoglycan-binding domain-containing protein [Chthoniobacterales bacterium]|nr:peptidoglycan-binding domain-containing protein [Chthoniobacterales bacterium]